MKKKINNPFKLKQKHKIVSIWKPMKPTYKRTVREQKLIRTNPWGDRDRDLVPNWIDCKPFDRRKQGSLKPYKFKAITPQGKEKFFRYKTRAQAEISRRNIDPSFKEVTEIYPVGSIYSIRPFREKYDKKIYPSETGSDRSFTRDTGYEGTGIFGFSSEDIAQHNLNNREGYVREFKIANPFIPTSDYRADKYFEASKLMQRAVDTKKRTKEGRQKYIQLLQDAKYNIDVASRGEINPTIEELKKVTTYNRKSVKTFQPITRLLMKKGYEGYIPTEKYQNFGQGSVAFMDKVPKDRKPFTSEENKRKKKYYRDKKEESKSKIEAMKTQFGEDIHYKTKEGKRYLSGLSTFDKRTIPNITTEQLLEEVEQEEKNIKGTYNLTMEKMKEQGYKNPESMPNIISVMYNDQYDAGDNEESNIKKKFKEKGMKSIQREFYERRMRNEEKHPATLLYEEDFGAPTAEEILKDLDENNNMIPDEYEEDNK